MICMICSVCQSDLFASKNKTLVLDWNSLRHSIQCNVVAIWSQSLKLSDDNNAIRGRVKMQRIIHRKDLHLAEQLRWAHREVQTPKKELLMVCCQQEKWRQNANPGEETAFSPSEGQDGWTHKTCNRNKWINFLIVEKLHLLVLFMALFYGKNHLSINFWFAAMEQYKLNGMPPVNWTIEICQWVIAHLSWSKGNGWHSVVPLEVGL